MYFLFNLLLFLPLLVFNSNKAMQKREDLSQPLGICHRLFHLIMTGVIWFKRGISSGEPVPHVSTEPPTQHDDVSVSKDAKVLLSPPERVKDQELPEESTTSPVKQKDSMISKPILVNAPKKSVSSKDGAAPEEGKRKANNKTGKLTVRKEKGDMKAKPWPPLTLGANINEKSDDFIRQRKEAMQRTNTIDPKKVLQ